MRRRTGTRTLAAVLFTDIVDSSTIAGRLGDARWKELIARHHAIVRAGLKRYGGRELDTAGDGFYASFSGPAPAILCACEMTDSIRVLGVEMRTGVHFGECEQVGGKLAGLTVVVGARVMSLGGPGDVLVTGTVRELVGGAGFGFEDRGTRRLKGVDGEWPVFSVTAVEGSVRPGPLEAAEAERRLDAIEPSGIRRRAWIYVGAAIAALAAIVWLVLLRPSGEVTPTLARIPPDHVGWIDPRSEMIGGALAVGAGPTGIAVGDDAVWVTRLEAGTVARVGPEGDAVETLSTGGHPTAIALDGAGAIWILNGFEATVVRLDPVRMTIDERIELETGAKDLAAGAGAVWVTNANDRSLTRIDLVTGEIDTVRLDGVGIPDGVAVASDAVWVAGSAGVAKMDPGSLEEIDRWPLRFPAGKVAIGSGAVWVTHLADDQVSEVDPSTGPVSVVPVGNGPVRVATGGGSVWVTNGLDGSVSVIDPGTGLVTRIEIGANPEGIAFGRGSVWVTVPDG